MSFWSFGRFVSAAVRRWFPTPLRHHCVILWAGSTLITKAYIAASYHGVVRRFVRHRWRVIDPRVSLSSGFFLWSCHCRTLLPFTCAHDSFSLVIVTCFAMSFTLRSAAIARLVLDASLLHYTRASRPTLLKCAVQYFCCMRNSVFSFLLLIAELHLSAECGLLFIAPSLFSLRCIVFLLNAAVFADLALYLAVGGLCLGRVELSCPPTPSSCFKHFWHRFFGCQTLLCGASHALLPHSLSSSPAQDLQH